MLINVDIQCEAEFGSPYTYPSVETIPSERIGLPVHALGTQCFGVWSASPTELDFARAQRPASRRGAHVCALVVFALVVELFIPSFHSSPGPSAFTVPPSHNMPVW